MESTEFIKLAEKTLENIFNTIEAADADYHLDCDLLDGVLQIELEDGGIYVINKHEAAKEIWMSSPVSSASHFKYKDGKWLTSNGNNLHRMLKNELLQKANVSCEFPLSF